MGSCGVGLHVEGLDGGGVAVDHDGLGELAGDVGLVGGAEVVAVVVGVFDLAGGVGFFEHGVGFVVGEAGEAVGCGGAETEAGPPLGEMTSEGMQPPRVHSVALRTKYGVLRFAQDDNMIGVGGDDGF